MSELIKLIGWFEEYEVLLEERFEIKEEIRNKKSEIEKKDKIIKDEADKYLDTGLSDKVRRGIVLADNHFRKLDDEIKELREEIAVLDQRFISKENRRRQISLDFSFFFVNHIPLYGPKDKILLSKVDEILEQGEINKFKEDNKKVKIDEDKIKEIKKKS